MARANKIEVRVLVTVLAIMLALIGFAALAAEVREGDVFAIDRTILLAFRTPGHLDVAIGPRGVSEAMRDITALGGYTVLTIVTVVASLLMVLHRRWAQALVFVGAVVFAQIAAELIKAVIARPRPMLVPHLDLVYSNSFPSGHALLTPVVYLSLAAVLAAGERSASHKVVLIVCAVLLVVAVGVTRVYLGVHWPTDVLAGWALGTAIALAATLALHAAAPRVTGPSG